MKKKGFILVDESLKLILAAIILVFLIVLLVEVYLVVARNQEQQNLGYAKGTLNNIMAVLASGGTQVQVYNPKGWSISYFPATFSSGQYKGYDLMPQSCSSQGWKSCICIYDLGSIKEANQQGSLITLSFTGSCQQSDFEINNQNANSIQINNPPVTLDINQDAKTIQEAP